jgi:hypothetical protein
LKKVESKAAQSGEESDVAEFSALLFKSPKGLTFKRRVTLGSAQNKDHLIRGFGLQGEPLWSLSESLTGFNQLVLEGAFNAYLLPEQINHDSYPPGFYPVIGEVSITIDNDAINLESNLKKDSKLREKLIAKLLGETVKIFFDGAISIDRLIPMVGKHLRGRNLGAFEYQCMPPTSETANSIMNGVPRFAEGYLRNLEYFLQSHL